MANNKTVGVITEQGFVAGMGLGFIPTKLNENDTDEKNQHDKKPESNK